MFTLLSPSEDHAVSTEERLRSQSVWEAGCEQLANLKQLNCSALLSHKSSVPSNPAFPAGSQADDEVQLRVEKASEQGVQPSEEVA